MEIYFGLGSNLGDRLQNIKDAIERLKFFGDVVCESSIRETEPWGVEDQPKFLNACVKVKAAKNFSPLDILRTIKNFETELGRVESRRWGERKIDIDILLVDDMIYHSPELNIPHINLPDRLFVLDPLEEITPPDWQHPETHKTIPEMKKGLRRVP
ncbi:MAG: 2-amino-4-hydroxy-6-hydroxymethyldihydropteridine diphosphokinase [Synergistaceae bacterium]|nr:2-amino-4-hydroxy-6-hydroxymethyldihydropteridine diphosphokinase [Synergistaceae bacterium]